MARCTSGLNSVYKRLVFVFLLSLCVLLMIKQGFINEKFIRSVKVFGKEANSINSESIKSISTGSNTDLKIETEVHFETEEEFMKRIASRMKERRILVRNVCKKMGLPKNPFHDQVLMEAKRYRFLYCRVPKAGSTNMDRVFSQLIKETDYPKIKSKTAERNHSPHRVEFVTERSFALEEIKKFLSVIIVRDPFIRLLSSFLMKIHNKGKNPDGVLDAAWTGAHELPINMSFADYVDHLLTHPGLFSTLEKHWALYVDLCQPCHVRYDVIAQLETIEEDTRYLLNLVGAPRNVSYSRGPGHDGKSRTKKDGLTSFFNTVTKNKLRSLYKLYQADFELFGYTIPEFL